MRIEGTRAFRAPCRAVFDALTDPELVAESLPAVEKVSVRDPDHWTASVKLPIAPRLTLAFELLERRVPEHARLHASGRNLGSSLTMDTSFDLESTETGTSMRYVVETTLGGLLGRLGDAALRPIADRQVERLLAAIERRVAARPAAA